ncbi:hypothetical protein MCOR14_008120 [Pyricularia oryzae]|uniref:Uncharacterized protein n=1 Tax=Pyricularia grisea TaxID=148305 RepID=A0ABQ8N5B8_PYRGI|nr:hypothetical protein MCOR33_010519 [Pyricularia grisea]KAI6414721.1 hypothetical protein MCOR24_006251 [Pyricularia oryzae]KAI6488798.1 hypothetical protein MCOR18_002805 [Pyricularia oryzae]KAI6523685.1 hypothetical protein MCOR05_009985 [Pyricularia oryzae]KAI6590750.1 hypothetical protein MCOR06_004943 [Pyricularia oryzae]
MSSSSETSPLLERSSSPEIDHLPDPNGVNGVEEDRVPIFLRTAHSPWPYLMQNDEYNHSLLQSLFQFSSITLFMMTLYQCMVFGWTFMHFHYPNGGQGYSGIKAKLLNAAAPPEQRPNSPKSLFFSLFFTISHVAAFMNTFIYVTVLAPYGHGIGKNEKQSEGSSPGDKDKPGNGNNGNNDGHRVIVIDDNTLRNLALISLFVLPSVVALLEILFLNSIKPQIPLSTHIQAVNLFAMVYLVWAYIGMSITGHDPFLVFDPPRLASNTVLAVSSFAGLASGMFSVMHALISFREAIIKKLRY